MNAEPVIDVRGLTKIFGDKKVVDALDLKVPADELANRKADWKAPAPRYRTGVFAKYAATVASAAEGAITVAQ